MEGQEDTTKNVRKRRDENKHDTGLDLSGRACRPFGSQKTREVFPIKERGDKTLTTIGPNRLFPKGGTELW